jgi:hypothetical protein
MSTSENHLNLQALYVSKRKQYSSDAYAAELRISRHNAEKKAKHEYSMRCEKQLENCYTIIAVLSVVTAMLIAHIVA